MYAKQDKSIASTPSSEAPASARKEAGSTASLASQPAWTQALGDRLPVVISSALDGRGGQLLDASTELTHVVQQASSIATLAGISSRSNPWELLKKILQESEH